MGNIYQFSTGAQKTSCHYTRKLSFLSATHKYGRDALGVEQLFAHYQICTLYINTDDLI